MGEVFATASFASPLGTLRAAATQGGIVRIELPRGNGSGFQGWLESHLPDGERVKALPLLEDLRRELEEYFGGVRRTFDLALDLRGTSFQLQVWRALTRIPYGETRSYAEVARTVKRSTAFRAIGGAAGTNPVPLLVPCHRVIASGGKLGGFGGGLEAKRRLLALERGAAPGSLL